MAPDFRLANIYFKSEYPKLYSEKIIMGYESEVNGFTSKVFYLITFRNFFNLYFFISVSKIQNILSISFEYVFLKYFSC